MTQDHAIHPDPSRRRAAPYVVLSVALALTAVATGYVSHNLAQSDAARFRSHVREVQAKIRSRFEVYAAMLRAANSFCAASFPPTLETYRAFAKGLDLPRQYPGALGLGFSVRFREADEKTLIVHMRTHGVPDFHVWPQSHEDEHHAIVFLEPLDERKANVIGYDMYSEAVRRAAMQRARDSGRPAASGRVRLIQETDEHAQAGFLMYFPVYRPGAPSETLAQRRDNLVGFVYSPFRADDLFGEMFEGDARPALSFSIYDGPPNPENLLHNSDTVTGEVPPAYQPRYKETAQMNVAGGTWTITFFSRPEFHSPFPRVLIFSIAIGGMLISTGLFMMTRREVTARSRAETIARDLRNSQEELRLSESKFRRLVDSNLIGVVFADMDGRILDGNDAFMNMIGRSRQQVRGGTVRWQDLTPTGYRGADEHAMAELRSAGVCTPYEKELTRGDKLRVAVMVGIARLEASGTECVGFAVDLTELKRSQQELEAARQSADQARAHAEAANRLKDEFLATLSHELRTPLNAILGWAQLLHGNKLDAAEVAHGVEIIERNARAQAQLIEDLLDISRIISGKLRLDARSVDPTALLKSALSAVRLAADAKGVRLVEDIEPTSMSVWGDPDRLQQVVWNLLSNAIKFTPPGGTVETSLRQQGGNVKITIKDSGKGISPEFLPYVFERFRQADASTTRKYGGLGLGLAIVRHLVEQHGGSVSASSGGEGQGAAFTVTLPVKALPVVPHGARLEDDVQAADGGESLSGVRVLVVEDEPDTRDLLVRILSDQHAQVTAVESARDAIELLRRSGADVIVSDIGMPDMDGYALLAELRTLPPAQGGAIPAIALTAFARAEDRRRALGSGYQLHLPKPVDASDLTSAIASLVGRISR